MEQQGTSTLPVQRPPKVEHEVCADPVPGTQAAPYGSAFAAAYAANVAKVQTMHENQARRMLGLSVGLRRASAVGFVLPAAAPQAVDVNVRGTPAVGFTVTGHYVYFDPNGDPEGTSIYAWLRDGVAIAGATAVTYPIVAADGGKKLQFRVTPVSSVGPTTGAAVTSSAGTVAP